MSLRVPVAKPFLLAVVITPILLSFGWVNSSVDAVDLIIEDGRFALDTGDPDSLIYPIPENGDGGLYLNNPSNFREEVTYDPETGLYTIQKYIGSVPVGSPTILTQDQYKERAFGEIDAEYFPQRVQMSSRAESMGGGDDRESDGLIPEIRINSQTFADIFGGNTIEIRPQGTAEIRIGARYQKIENPIIPVRNQRTFAFDFDQRIQINITGKIGERLSLSTNYDTEATFAFENKMKLGFEGQEDDIIKNLEMGNVSLPVNSSLITGAQSLFGVKGKFQFGKTTVTTVFSEQRSQSQSISVQGGATQQEFEIWGDQYEANRHYFLSQYFRDHYEEWLASMPVVNSPVQITKVEIWVTNRRSVTEDVRNIVAFMDLGENQGDAYRDGNRPLSGPDIFPGSSSSQFPNNGANQLEPSALASAYPGVRDIGDANAVLNSAGFIEATEFVELTNARKLQPSQFKLDPQLGILSLNEALNQDEVLAVAFQYTAFGQTYQVGEFSNDGVNPPSTLILKMLKSTILDVKTPLWDLMMKNVYSLGAFQVSQEDFRLQVLYMNDETGTPVPYLPNSNLDDSLLLNVMSLDQLNYNNDPVPDGLFDFVEGRTINSQNGRIFFPVLEPFGERLSSNLTSQEAREKYVFQELYDSTRFRAQEQTQKNKYLLKGQYKSSSGSVIQLNAFNIPQGSVTVSAGGAKLTENQDYTVDYNLGQVRIINESILNSGVPINVSFENNSLFNFQTKTFAGATFDHKFSDNFNVGGALLHLRERPLTQKVNLGDEPIANTIWGLNTQYNTDAPFLTRMVDAIPFIDTKEPSSITFQGEFAHMIPGSPSGIKIGEDGATTYIDDFESSQTNIDIRGATSWLLASTPAGQPSLFPEGNLTQDLAYNYNRAKLAWYIIDPVFYQDNAQTPDNIRSDKNLISDHRTRQVPIKEVFPNTSLQQGTTVQNIATFDLAFYPEERGPYNYEVGPTNFSAGMGADGKLNDPDSRWAGVMRPLQVNNFEEQNIEFIQFWIMDPYAEDSVAADVGDLYFNLGSISEDILKDGRQSFENGLDPTGDISDLDSTVWGYTTQNQPIVDAFDNDPTARANQDVGLDGLRTEDERTWRYLNQPSYTERVESEFGAASVAYTKANADPSADNFGYYRGSSLDNANAGILRRYRDFNGTEGNSSIEQVDGYPAFATNLPDKEDVNRDLTLSKTETYFQYKVSMAEADLQTVGQNYITDIRYARNVKVPNSEVPREVKWIQFKIPIFEPDQTIGQIGDFRSIRFIRMFLKGFNRPVVLRFARLDLVRGEWRRYRFDLNVLNENVPIDGDGSTIFNVNAVNLEENGSRDPINYVLPPGIDRQVLFGTTSTVQANEQSLSLYTCGLEDGDARAVFRNLSMDMRMYGNLKMFAHAEAGGLNEILRDGDVNLFVRVGSDYNNNYYEYEIPLTVTQFGETDPDRIWPSSNDIDLDLDLFKEVKLERDQMMQGNPNFSRQTLYSVPRGRGSVSVLGSPNLGNVRTILIGIRNPKKRLNDPTDDGQDKCAEVWVNELRLTDFDNRGGWAANARMTAKLADFANVSLTGNYSSVGYGSLDQGPQERNQFEALSYNLQTNVEMGKFFNDDIALRIPVFFNLSEEWQNPMFNPLDPDIEFPTALENLETTAQRDSLKALSQDYTLRRDINLTNVRKDRSGSSTRRPQFYDIENFSVSYSFSEVYRRNVNTQLDRRVDHRGTLNYTFQTSAKPWKPLENVVTSEYLKLIRDFNFQWYPQRFSFRGDVVRSYQQLQMRNVDNPDPKFALPENWNKNFRMDRNYNVAWDLTERIKIDYTALQRVRFDELAGPISNPAAQEYLRNNLEDLGRPTNYHQTLQVTWQLPVDKIPYFEFVNASLRYTGDYDWQAISLIAREDTALNYGNTIQNSANWQANLNLNMSTLYNKFPFIKRLSQPAGGGNRRLGPVRRQLPGSGNAAAEDQADDDNKDGFGMKLARFGVGLLTMVKNVNGTYTINQGTLLPGYLPEPVFFGMSDVSGWSPGAAFALGWQVPVAEQMAELELADDPALTNDKYLTQRRGQPNRYTEMENTNLQVRGTIEPISDLRIDVNFTRTTGYNYNSVFRYIGTNPDDQVLRDAFGTGFQHLNPMSVNTYSISWLAWGSAFESSSDRESVAYNQFLENRFVLSGRLAEDYALQDPNYNPTFDPDSGYSGYSVFSQQAMIPAFISAYGGAPSDQIGMTLNELPKVPMPNWRLNYTGLMRLEWFKENFSSFALSSSYSSTLQVANYQTNLLRQQQLLENPNVNPRDLSGDFMPEFQVSQVSMTEAFRPLVGFNMRMKNNTTFKFDYNRDRNISMSLANQQITDTKGNEITVGAGYIIKDVKFNFITTGASRTPVNSNLELRVDLSIRDNVTVIRRIAVGQNQITAGQRLTTIKFTADYKISRRITAQLYYDQNIAVFKTSSAFPTNRIQTGISIRLSLAN
ncbi:MAG: cell surface protein SprA [Bacteroidetes bacterium]|nr:MAG: cell surface protein SprA [Bacteroidota bacterium]